MSLNIIGGERESLTFSGEVHKKAIRNYLESLGYSQTTDSYVEGHLPDMIFVNRDVAPGREFWIESKATNVGISEKKFSKGLIGYLISWLKHSQERRFTLMIFAQQVSRLSRWRSLFETYDRELIDDWIQTNISQLTSEEKKFLDSIDKNEIYTFFQNTVITIGLSAKLDIAAEEKRITSSLSLTRKANLLLNESERRNNLIEEKNELITNLLNFEYPQKIFRQKTSCKNIEELYLKTSKSELPPFMLSGEYLYSFCDANDMAVFEDVLVGNPCNLNSQDFLSSNEQEFVKIMNFHIDKYAKCRGLRKFMRTLYFFSLKPNENGDFKERSKLSYTGFRNFVAKPMFDKIDDKKLNYVFHRAVNLSAKIIWGKPYIIILPSRHFTSDGKTPIEGINKDRLDRKYRNPAYNRSEYYLRLTKFWKFCLFDQKFENLLFADWFKDFKFKSLESISVLGIPKSVNKSQSLLSDSFGGDLFDS